MRNVLAALLILNWGLAAYVSSQEPDFSHHTMPGSCLVDKEFASDGGTKISACAASLPTSGGVIDARALTGPQAITISITVNRPTILLLNPSAVFTVSNSGEFVVTSDLRVIGGMQATNTLARGTTFRVNKPGALFRFPSESSSRVGHFELASLQIQGGGGSFDNYVVDVPDTSGGSFSGNQARWHFHDVWVAGMGSSTSTKAALNFGKSIYWIGIERCVFNNNAGGDINTGYADDLNITHNFFWQLSATQPHIRMVGGTKSHIAENEFETNTGSTMPDILLQTESNNQRGFVDIIYNKFGSENETGARSYKVRAYSASFAGALISQINFIGNQVTGPVGSTMACAIQTDNPISDWHVRGNTFANISTLLCDAQPVSNTGGGKGIFKNNVITAPVAGTKCFTNGGRGFWDVDQPECSDSPRRKTTEQPELRNRLLYSEDLSNAAWTKSTGITPITGQTDPYGTTRAVQLANNGTTSGASASAIVSNTSLGNRVWVKFWAKAGTLDRLDISYSDTNSGNVPNDGTFKLKLDSTWREYKVSFTTLNVAHSQALYLYVGDQSKTSNGNLYVFGVQVSDYDSDYVKTTGAAFADTNVGTAYSRGVIFNSFTFVTLPASAPDGEVVFCSDCTRSTPTASRGTGSLLVRVNGQWAGF